MAITCNDNSADTLMVIREPTWIPQVSIERSRMPPGLFSWMTEQHSMTRRLRQLTHDKLVVSVIKEGVQPVYPGEARRLGLSLKSLAWVREVKLCFMDESRVMMYARSVFPLCLLRGPLCVIKRLGNTPLGEIIYRPKPLKRSALEFSKLKIGVRYFEEAARCLPENEPAPTTLWGRRYTMIVAPDSFLLTEVFLPTVWQKDHRFSSLQIEESRV